MTDNKAAALVRKHQGGHGTRAVRTAHIDIIAHRRRLCKSLRRLAGTLSAALLVAAAACLAEGLGGTPAYLPAALACLLAANGCAGVAIGN